MGHSTTMDMAGTQLRALRAAIFTALVVTLSVASHALLLLGADRALERAVGGGAGRPAGQGDDETEEREGREGDPGLDEISGPAQGIVPPAPEADGCAHVGTPSLFTAPSTSLPRGRVPRPSGR